MKHFKILLNMMTLVFGGKSIKSLFYFMQSFFVKAGEAGSQESPPTAANDSGMSRFEETMVRLKMTEKDLVVRQTQLKIEFWVFFSLLMIGLLFFGANIQHGGLAILGSLAVVIFSFTRTMISSYRFWNIKTRTINEFKLWMKTPQAWIPSS